MDSILSTLRDAWSEARAGRGRFIHLLGAVGAGKTTLLSHLVEQAEGAGSAAIIQARCFDPEAVESSERGTLERLAERLVEGVRALSIDLKAGTSSEVPWLLPGGEFLSVVADLGAIPSGEGIEPLPHHVAVAELLLDLARQHAILLALDDAHRADAVSRLILAALAERLASPIIPCRLLVVITSSRPLVEGDELPAVWCPVPSAVLELPPLDVPTLAGIAADRLAGLKLAESDLIAIAEVSGGNPLVQETLLQLGERAGLLRLKRKPEPLRELSSLSAWQSLSQFGQGRLPALSPELRADLEQAAVVGARFDLDVLAKVWSSSEEVARGRVDAMIATGLVLPRAGRYAFISAEIAAHLRERLAADERAKAHGRVGALLRAEARITGPDELKTRLDVTETWSENRRKDRRRKLQLARLWSASGHYALAGQPVASAEAAVTFAERLLDSIPPLAYRLVRREDREQRLRAASALDEAATQLRGARLARVDDHQDTERLSTHVRLLTAKARLRGVAGRFAEARELADAAFALTEHLGDGRDRLETMKVCVELAYASGAHQAARRSLRDLLDALERAEKGEACRCLGWLAEALGRWEWIGLHERLFPYILERLRSRGAWREVIKAQVDRLSTAIEQGDSSAPLSLLTEVIEEARRCGELPYLAEQLALYAADVVQSHVDIHQDSLSGEFYPPDFTGETGSVGITERLSLPIDLLVRAEVLAEESNRQVSELRVLTTVLGIVYETRERVGQLLERWLPGFIHETIPPRLIELVDLMERGFFEIDRVEALTRRIVHLASVLGFGQVVGDTLYEALDRDLPGVIANVDALNDTARVAYESVRDVYGLITLDLVHYRHLELRGRSGQPCLDRASAILDEESEAMGIEQRAFVHLRLGEIKVQNKSAVDEAVIHLEKALQLYEQVGDIDSIQSVGEMLRDVYRQQGNLARYRSIRDRVKTMDWRSPELDPLGLEIRVEQLLNQARQEEDDERAIEMVERCIRLFERAPDSLTRVDECYVEISKICRRRADEAQTEAGFSEWLRRSLDAGRAAAAVNQNLGNYRRVFEEYRELFDDLLALGDEEEYIQTRADIRKTAFAVGDISELMMLFDEHLEFDPEVGFKSSFLPELRGFFEALDRYLKGVGATESVLHLRRVFRQFLEAVGESSVAEYYQTGHFAS